MGGVPGTSTVGGDKGLKAINNFIDKLNVFEKKNKTPSEGGQNTDYRDGDSGPAQVPAETTPAQKSGHYEVNGRPLGSDELPGPGAIWVEDNQ